MAITNEKVRKAVYNKFGGRCAYCGTELVKGWNIDHVKPKVCGGTDDISNLKPSCRDCNNYKCHSTLEEFRRALKIMLNEKLNYLFRSKTKMDVGIKFGVIKLEKWDGIFYFEKLNLKICSKDY